MRTVIGWMAAMLASALLGAAVYQTVLSKPLPELDPTATVETIGREPSPGPTLYRTEVRTVVEPTPTVTVEDKVLVAEEVVEVSQPRAANPAPARTSAPKPRATAERNDDSEKESAERNDDSEKESARRSDDSEKESADEPEDRDSTTDSADEPEVDD